MKGKLSKRMMGCIVTHALAISLLTGMCANVQAAVKPVKIIMQKSKISLVVGQKKALKVKKVKPSKANRSVKYSSSNKKIAKVNKKGVVTGMSKGNCDIRIISKSNKKVGAKVKVTVKNKKLVMPDATVTPVMHNTQTPATEIPHITAKPTAEPAPTALATAVVRPTVKPVPTNNATKLPVVTSTPRPEPPAAAPPSNDGKGEWIKIDLKKSVTDEGFGGSVKITDDSVILSGTTDHVMFPIGTEYEASQIIEVYFTGISYSKAGQTFRTWSGGRNNARTSDVVNNLKAEYGKGFSVQQTFSPLSKPEKPTFDSFTIASGFSGAYFDDFEITSVYYRVSGSSISPEPSKSPTSEPPLVSARPIPPVPEVPSGDEKGEWIKIDLNKAAVDKGFGGSFELTEYGSVIFSVDTEHVMFPIGTEYEASQIIEVYFTGISYSKAGQTFRTWSGGRNNARTSDVVNNLKAEYGKGFSVQQTFSPLSKPEKPTFDSITITSGVSGRRFNDLEITSIYYRVQ